MPLLIDGHNLIGQMQSISLDDPNDEAELILRLRSYHARTRTPITVIFDHGLPGGPSRWSNGSVRVVFAASGSDADRLLARRIRRHPKPRSLTVVTSDREVIRTARQHRAQVIRATDFAATLEAGPPAPEPEEEEDISTRADLRLSEDEVNEWLSLFEGE